MKEDQKKQKHKKQNKSTGDEPLDRQTIGQHPGAANT